MYIFAFLLLVASFLCALFCAGVAAVGLFNKDTGSLKMVEKGSYAITAFMTMSVFILLAAFVNNDFSLEYVARYSDTNLHIFYRMTAIWAGAEGSLLFWAWSVAIFGVFFLVSESYTKLTDATRLFFWMFFLGIIAFFMLLTISWNNPFIILSPAVPDGNGMNPLLQNPGMIFHPPLLFLGYGGFVIPGCLALAQALSNNREAEGPWSVVCRPFTLLGWLLLSAGIILGAWWAYMELGWGGYWAWDPVENASLIPWLIATAFLHTSVVEARRGKLVRFNMFLMSLTTISAFFATFIVRGGILRSVHGFSESGVGVPLLIFVIIATLLTVLATVLAKPKSQPLANPLSREGLLVFVATILLALSVIIIVATLWPILSQILSNLAAVEWTTAPILEVIIQIWDAFGADASRVASGEVTSTVLSASFYNTVCLPIMTIMMILLVFCPWISWAGGFRNKRVAIALAVLFFACLPIFMQIMEGYSVTSLNVSDTYSQAMQDARLEKAQLTGIDAKKLQANPDLVPLDFTEKVRAALHSELLPRHLTAQVAASASVIALLGIVLLFAFRRSLLRSSSTLAAHGVHIGVIAMALGIAFSGPYQREQIRDMSSGEEAAFAGYIVKINDYKIGAEPGYRYIEPELLVYKDTGSVGKDAGKERALVGKMYPQSRIYTSGNREQQAIESYTIIGPGGEELYASVLSASASETDNEFRLRMSIHPLVNWIWYGGIVLCLFPFVGIFGKRKEEPDAA